ncbi:MAG: hypothetical protein K6T90_20335 [Leptolyngbyaceae cyanobacterium HOT.MB2.61]|nr:hypothetical protein [Leptolyngbyaceae cyanobacterium HOT.MB2.61]
MEIDNILVDASGKPWRIDNGGSLRYRAQGTLKGDRWNNYPTELFTLRNPDINDVTAEVFDLTHAELVEQLEALVKNEKKLLKALPKDLHPTIKSRLAEMQHLAKVSRTLLDDQWTDTYTGNFARHTLGLRESGIANCFPKKLTQKDNDVIVKDENGIQWDSLRGPRSIVEDLAKYMSRNGGNHEIISNWMEEQADDSWNTLPSSFKYWFHAQRRKSSDTYYWGDGFDSAKQAYDNTVNYWERSTYQETLTSWHAFNHEMLNAIQFNKKNADNTVTLMRTENKKVIQGIYGLKPGDRSKLMKRSFAESTSIYNQVSVYGTELIPILFLSATDRERKSSGQ